MARKPRELSRSGIYHVMIRGNHKDNIFHFDDDCRQFLHYLQRLVELTTTGDELVQPYCKVYAYCLMTNHVHLLIQEQGESISEIIKRLNISYVAYYNKKYDKRGHLFEDRFRSEPVNDAGYFLTLLRYIHQNPIEAKLVDNLNQYRWSSWHDYMQERNHSRIISSTYPEMFGGLTWDEVRLHVCVENGELAIAKQIGLKEKKSNAEAITCLEELCKPYSIPVGSIKQQSKDIRASILRSAREKGIGVRQLSRLTGVSTSVIIRLFTD